MFLAAPSGGDYVFGNGGIELGSELHQKNSAARTGGLLYRLVKLFLFPSRFVLIAPLGALPSASLAVDAWVSGRRLLPALALTGASFLVLFPYLFPAHTPMFSPFVPVETLSQEDTRAYEPRANAWGMTSFNEFLVQGADIRVITGEIPEPNATRLTWRSPHEALADLSAQAEPMLLRLHYHPGWSAGERATLSRGPYGWMQVTALQSREQPLVIRWEGTVWQRWGESRGQIEAGVDDIQIQPLDIEFLHIGNELRLQIQLAAQRNAHHREGSIRLHL